MIDPRFSSPPKEVGVWIAFRPAFKAATFRCASVEYPEYGGISGVRGNIRSTGEYPEYGGISGVRGNIRGTGEYPGYGEISGVRGNIRGTGEYPGYGEISGVRGNYRFPGTRVRSKVCRGIRECRGTAEN